MELLQLINPTERQREFLQAIADHDFVLYGGAAGGGKSYILRWWLITYLCQLFKYRGLRNVQVALFCEDYPSLYDRQISKIKFEFPAELGQLKEGTVKNFQLRPELGGGILALRNLDDPSKYQSAEFAAIGVDELTKNSKETFDFLRFRLRWPGITRPKFAGATNPGGRGHAWVKKLWIQREFPPELKPKAQQFSFVRAKASDNPHLSTEYADSLRTLPPDMAKKFADGSWDVYTGQFYPQFDENRHCITRAEAQAQLKPWHPRWLSGDWGFYHPHSIYKLARDEHGRIIVYGELWDRMVNEQELGKRIGELCKPERDAKIPIKAFPFSWDAFGKLSPRAAGKVRKSITALIDEGLPDYVPRPNPADSSPGSRISGARLIGDLLDSDFIRIVAEDCPKLVQCLPTLIRDEDHPEDVAKVDWNVNEIGDDPYDAVRMGIQNMVGVAQKPFAVKRQEVLASFDDKLERIRQLREARS